MYDKLRVDTNVNYCYALTMELFEKESLQKGPACRQAGQTLLIVVLIMVISLTVGLSIASKTITNLRTTTEEADSAKALSAAETGVQQQLKSSTSIDVERSVQTGTTFKASLTSVSGTSFLVNGGNVIPQDEGADVWLIAHNPGGDLNFISPWTGTLTIYWGDSSVGCNNAALEVIIITGTSPNDAKTTRYGYDPCLVRTSSNNLTFVSSSLVSSSEKNFYHTANISGITNGLLVRIIPLYANTVLAVAGSPNALPQQGSIITSSGKSGNVERKISVVANYSSLPSQFFTYGLFVPK